MQAVIQGSGPPVVLIHGLGAHAFSWRDTVAAIGSGYRTYAVDLLGFGQSPAPAGFPCTMAAQADAVAAFLAAEGIADPVLIGHSMGGGVCLGLAARADLTLRKLVLLAPVAYAPPPRLPGQDPLTLAAFAAAPEADPAVQGRLLVQQILKAAYADRSRITGAQVDGYAEEIQTPAQLAAFYGHLPKLGQVTVPEAALGGIEVETLVIWGDDDMILPVGHGVALAAKLPHALLERIADCGHIPHEEQPDEANRLILSFL